MSTSWSAIIGGAAALGGIYYMYKALSYGFRTENRYYEYVLNPIERRRSDRSTFDLTVPEMSVDEASYEAFLEDSFIDETSRVGFLNYENEEGIVTRGRTDWQRINNTFV